MKKLMITACSFVFAFALAGLSSSALAADEVQEAYKAFNQQVAPLEQQLYAKQGELDAIYSSPQPDTAKAQELFREIGDLEGKLFTAQMELRAKMGNSGARYPGMMHHPGEFSRSGPGFRGHGGGHHW